MVAIYTRYGIIKLTTFLGRADAHLSQAAKRLYALRTVVAGQAISVFRNYPGSYPFDLIKGTARGPVRNLSNSLAAWGSAALALTPAGRMM